MAADVELAVEGERVVVAGWEKVEECLDELLEHAPYVIGARARGRARERVHGRGNGHVRTSTKRQLNIGMSTRMQPH